MTRSVLYMCLICTYLVSGHAVESGKCVAGSGPFCAGPDDATLLQKLVAVHDDELNTEETSATSHGDEGIYEAQKGEAKPHLVTELAEDSDVESEVVKILEKQGVGEDAVVQQDSEKWGRRRRDRRRHVFYKYTCDAEIRRDIKACTFDWKHSNCPNLSCLGKRCEAMAKSSYCSRQPQDLGDCQKKAEVCNLRSKLRSCGSGKTRGQPWQCFFKAHKDCHKDIMKCVECISNRCRYRCVNHNHLWTRISARHYVRGKTVCGCQPGGCRRSGYAFTEANTSHIEPFSSPTFETIPQDDEKEAFTAHEESSKVSTEGNLAAEGNLASQTASSNSGSLSLEEVKSGTMDESLTTKKTCG